MKNFTHFCKAAGLQLFFLLPFYSIFGQVTVTTANGIPVGSSMSGVAYGNGIYVAVGSSGNIASSTDAAKWTLEKSSSFINTSYTRVAFGNGLFVAITNDGKIVTSPDGSTWTQQTSGTTNYLNDVVYANSKFIIVGNSNTALTSTDGITWTSLNIGAASSDLLLSLQYAGGKFVVGVRDNATSGSRCFYSTTGAAGTWSSATIATYVSLNRICYLNNKYFCFTSSTNIYSSSDGISWSTYTNSRLTSPSQVFHGFYDGTKYYLFGSSPEYGYGSVFTSTDGTTFTLQSQTNTLVAQYSAYLNGKYFLVGNEGMVVSSNGTEWNFAGGSYNAIASNGTRFVGVGQVTSNQACIYTSTDWINWTSVTSTIFKPLNGVTFGNGKFVAVGNVDASSFGTIATSADGLSWSIGNSGIADALRSVAYGNSKYVAVGFNGRIIYSSNGTSWTSAENGTGYQYYGVFFVNNYFVAVGGSTVLNGQPKVKYSSDGITWTDVSPTLSGHFHSIAYGGGKYVLVGRDNTSGSQKFFSVTTTDITSGSYTSAVNVTTPDGDVGTVGYGGVAYNNSIFVAIANLKVSPFSAYILTSTDGTIWAAASANSTSRLRGIITSGTSFKVAGTGDTYLNISAGTTLPLRLTDFSIHSSSNGTVLSWETVNEENTNHFIAERSYDGRNFTAIGSVAAKNTTGHNEYTYADAVAAAGIKYYRLKMVDNDGKFTYSPVLKTGSAVVHEMISIYPNPSTGYFTLSLPKDIPATVTLHNNKGEKVLQRAVSGNSQMVNISELPSGTYFVQVVQAGKVYNEKIVKK